MPSTRSSHTTSLTGSRTSSHELLGALSRPRLKALAKQLMQQNTRAGSWKASYIQSAVSGRSSTASPRFDLSSSGSPANDNLPMPDKEPNTWTPCRIADRLRHGKIKFIYDPDYAAAKKKTASDRETSRLEFSTRSPNVTDTTTSSPPPTSTLQHKEYDDEGSEQVTLTEPTRPTTSMNYMKKILVAMVVTTQNQLATGERDVAIYDEQVENPLEEYATAIGYNVIYKNIEWTPLSVLLLVVLMIGMLVGYGFGFCTHRRERQRLQAQLAQQHGEAEEWKQKWWSTDTDLARALQEVIDLKVKGLEDKRKMDEEREIYTTKLQAAD